MSDASGPFAVPNFSQTAASEDEEFDGDDELGDDELVDGELDDDEIEGGDADDAPAPSVNVAEEAPSGPADGGVAQAVLEHIARSIVDAPDAVAVDASSQRGGVRLDLHVASSDMGRIVGRRGRVAQALRSVVRATAAKDGTDATVDIVD